MRHILDRPCVPRWVAENFDRPRRGYPAICAKPDASLLADSDIVYLIDGPTFPVGDGGSLVKSEFLRGILRLGMKASVIASDWSHEPSNAYAMQGAPTYWLAADKYYSDQLLDLVSALEEVSFIVDSCETLSRILPSIDPCRIWLLLFDDYVRIERIRSRDPLCNTAGNILQSALHKGINVLFRSRSDIDMYDTSSCRYVLPLAGVPTRAYIGPTTFGPVALLGNFRYRSNLDSIHRIVNEWCQDTPIRVIGDIDKNEVSALSAICKNIEFTYQVDDLSAALEGCSLGIDANESYSGTSTKILTYMSMGIPVACVQSATRGLNVDHATVRIANNVPSLVSSARLLSRDHSALISMARRGFTWIRRSCDIQVEIEEIVRAMSVI
ncbi:glycosyltransferase [Mycobacteroides abscessus]|uniref:glycosyltransferase n=1 Tax=Mycobacteroides abscessus TaxID=36809 RepID=UPI000D3E5E28|nr:hypothetical protein DDJ47_07460 [Mycobacteroides abscessus]RIT46043.1 glycosyltransferase [Mycobacteroides abscessus]